jgi:hypothetical protein
MREVSRARLERVAYILGQASAAAEALKAAEGQPHAQFFVGGGTVLVKHNTEAT